MARSLIAGLLLGVGLGLAIIAMALELPGPAVPCPSYDDLKVTELRTVARTLLPPGARPGGRPIAQARRSDLLRALR
ncbi:MAG: hypothetical protein AAFX65_07420 [Cyanobacteria bacterium J06638_7]